MARIYLHDILRAAQRDEVITSDRAMLRVEFSNSARNYATAHRIAAAIDNSSSSLETEFNYAGGGKLGTGEPDLGIYVDLSLDTGSKDFNTWFAENHQILGALLMANGATGMRTAMQYVPLKLNLQPINPLLPL